MNGIVWGGMILLLGGAGYVGSEYRRYFAGKGVEVAAPTRAQRDYTRPEILRALVREVKPRYVVNCAGYTGKPNVDACEQHKAQCLFGNAVWPGILREVCESERVPWGHVSSGCIYNGSHEDGSGFRESDAPNFSFRAPPCSFYSGTKALGEEVLEGAERCWIWRLRIPFDHREHPRNYLTKLMRYERLLEARNSLSHLGEFVRATVETIEREVPPGLYNVTQPGSITTRRVTELMRAAGVCDKAFHFFDNEADFMAKAAVAPRSNCVMDVRKLLATGISLTPVEASVEAALQRWERA